MKISDVAQHIKGIPENDDDTIEILGLSGIESAGAGDLTFALDEKRLSLAEKSRTACVLTTPTVRKSTKPIIRVNNPKLAFLVLYRVFYPAQSGLSSIHSSAVMSSSTKFGNNVQIGPHVSIEENVTIGDNTVIDNGCVIKKNCSIGACCHLYPRVVLHENTQLKENVVLHAGVVVGSDGFGYVKDKDMIHKFPQLGKVIIEENVEIGANCTIDRGSLGNTVIGANTKIDNLCHIAHNVKMGRNVLMAAQSGIAGGTLIGDNVMISGQVAIIDNVTIGDNAVIGGKSAVIGHVQENAVMWGLPARPLDMAKKQMAVLHWLTKNFSSLSKLIKNGEPKKMDVGPSPF